MTQVSSFILASGYLEQSSLAEVSQKPLLFLFRLEYV